METEFTPIIWEIIIGPHEEVFIFQEHVMGHVYGPKQELVHDNWESTSE